MEECHFWQDDRSATYSYKAPKETTIEEPSVFIRLSQLFRYSMSEMELYDYTRGYWENKQG